MYESKNKYTPDIFMQFCFRLQNFNTNIVHFHRITYHWKYQNLPTLVLEENKVYLFVFGFFI